MDCELTRNDIMAFIAGKEKIKLIKAYRDLTKVGLREAKVEIERFITASPSMDEDPHCFNRTYTYNGEGILNLFSPYIEQDLTTIKARIEQGVECALQNFAALGFDEPFHLIRIVLDNIQKKSMK